MHEPLFAYLEQDMAGDVASTWTPVPLVHAAALANPDWTDDEAAREIARVTDREHVLLAYAQVVRSLAQNPLVDKRGIRMSRILRRALDEYNPEPAHGSPDPKASKRRRLWFWDCRLS